MDYDDCLKLAGAEVHAFERFGSYQGDWLAKVTCDGKSGFIRGSYGSCSGCDEIESKLYYVWDDGSEDSKQREQENQRIAKTIGENHLNDFEDVGALKLELLKQAEWDGEASEMIQWLEANA